MTKYISDFHLHSEFSFDGSSKIKDICSSAINKGFSNICITDHCECNAKATDDNFPNDTEASYTAIQKAKEFFNDSNFRLYAGIEMGQAIENKTKAEEILSEYDFDFVLASLHNLPGIQDFYYIHCDINERKKLLEKYFDYILELIDWGKFDSLAHLTYPFRYICIRDKMDIKVDEFSKKIDKILEALAKKDIALEVNTSGLWQGLNDTLPPKKIIKRFKKLGGKYLTLGSDAHKAEDLGKGIPEALQYIKDAGFEHYVIFENRKPKFIKV